MMAYLKKALFCFVCAFVFAVIWLIFISLTDLQNYALVTLVVFVASSVSMSVVSMREYLTKGNPVLKKIISLTLAAMFSFAIMVGVTYLAIVVLLSNY